jgi:hypothetical protein
MWLLCSFQGPAERAASRSSGSVAERRARGLSKLNSMLRPSIPTILSHASPPVRTCGPEGLVMCSS